MSAAILAALALMGVIIFFLIQYERINCRDFRGMS